MSVNPLRHLAVFKPAAFGQRRVDVIGAGATGSEVAMLLARLGVDNIHVWDDDGVEEHNLANQLYGYRHVGNKKVDALAEIIKQATDVAIHPHCQKVDGSTGQLGQIVFLLTDTMASRREIAQKCLWYSLTEFMIETRMGADIGIIYSISPSKPSHIRQWEKTLYDDIDTSENACGATTTVGPTAKIVAGLAVWQMMRWFSGDPDDIISEEVVVTTRPMMIRSRCFDV